MGSAMSFDVIGIVLFIIKENKMARVYNQYSTEFKQTVCEYYSNHTWRVTAVHFGMVENTNTSKLCSDWYKALGFLPKSAGRNPNMARVKTISASKKRANAGFTVTNDGIYHNGKLYGEVKVGAIVKRNPITNFLSRLM